MMILSVLTQDRGWSVEYPDKLICAVRGFSVSIPCSYSYPQNYQFVWSKNNQRLDTSGPVLHFPALTVRDSGNYTCIWKTDETSGSETISLHVEDEMIYGETYNSWPFWMVVVVTAGLILVVVIYSRSSVLGLEEPDGLWKKLLHSLVVSAQILRYLFPDGRRVKNVCEGCVESSTMLFDL
ncbi:hypothetical protein QTP70_017276 [Hemibagrus guttatus]|uniref:Ig-like domain-containing protein n=1 Tax=Hemibagrus guttatus TaxID=175788 RepID=A0AAE0Q894_9TELE|nr:hypothetical protein QTP70_017276 [Hemibagrus guttatus]